MKCVTHDGDLFDPSGTLTGGSRATGASVLAKLHALSEAEAHLQTCTAALTGTRDVGRDATLAIRAARLFATVVLHVLTFVVRTAHLPLHSGAGPPA